MAIDDFNPEELSFKKVFQSFKNWPRIFKLLWDTNKIYFIIIMVLNILIGLVPAASLQVTGELIKSVTPGSTANLNRVLTIFVVLIIIALASNLISLGKTYFEGVFQSYLTYNINVKIMDKAKGLSLSDFENPDIYDKLQRAQREAGYRPFQTFMSILSIISGIVTLISSAAIVFMWKWWVGLILIIIPSISTVSLLKQGQREFLIQWKRAPLQRKSWYLGYLLTRDVTFKEVKLYNLGGHLLSKYKKIFMDFLKEDKKLLKRRTLLTFIFNMINEITVALVKGLIVYSTFIGEIVVGSLYAYISAVKLIQTNSMAILNTIFSMYQNNLYIKQLFDFLDISVGELEKGKGKNDYDMANKEVAAEEMLDTIKEIEFKNVSFKYQSKNTYALKNISIKINAGDNVAIVGGNGSGKTTFVKLLTRLYDVDEGEILINGIPIKKINPEILRAKIGVVFQDFIKYELSVRENIGFGDLNSVNDDIKLMKSAQRSGVDEMIKDLPKGFDNQLGVWFDEGTQLSGGQWQKIALSRAFIRNADAFVLDEPSSALDPLSEREIFDKFFELAHKKIGIFTSHRFSTVRFASKILVFDKGELKEYGTHDQLMGIDGHYAELYNIQASPFEKSEDTEKKHGMSS